MIPAVAYARFSSDNQREESIDAQVRAIRYYAQNFGYDVIRVYADKAKSGRSADREQFQQMIADSSSGDFKAVIVHKLDRFSRDSLDSLTYEKELRRNGVELISVNEKLDSTPEGILMKSIIMGMNQFYSANLAREVMKGLKENAYNGVHTGGTPPLGYDVDPKTKKLVINPREAEAVVIIYTMYNNDYGYSAIIDTLNKKGYTTKRGSKFGKNSLHDILKNEKYTGALIYNKSASKDIDGKHNRHKYKDESDWIKVENGCPQIIDKILYEEVLKKMETNRHRNASKKAKTTYLLSGILYCGICKKAMTGDTRRYRNYEYSYYLCSESRRKRNCSNSSLIKKDVIENTVLEKVNTLLFSDKNIKKICERIYKSMQSQNNSSKIAEINTEILKAETKMKNLTKAIANGTDVPEIHEFLKELSEQKRTLTIQKYELETVSNCEHMSLEEITRIFKENANIKKLTPENQKTILQKFIKRIYVMPPEGPNGKYRLRIIIAPFDSRPIEQLINYVENNLANFEDMDGNPPSPPYY